MEEASQDLIFECPSLGLTAGSLHRWWKVGAALLGRKEGLNVDIKFVTNMSERARKQRVGNEELRVCL
jgi:hypothetical protein